MHIKWLFLIKRTHLFLSVFFAPLLLMFILTGWWQTTTSGDDQEADGGFVHELLKKFSSVHTSNTYPLANAHHQTTWMIQWLIVAMCVALTVSILLGLCLAWQTMKRKWIVALAFVLGIVLPALALYFA